MIDREHVFGLRNEAGEGAEDVAGVRDGDGGSGGSFHGGLPRGRAECAGRIEGG